jgi:DEAD/DEAH box helicase domain-containing protein
MLDSFLEKLTDPGRHEWTAVHIKEIEEQEPSLEPIPPALDPRVAELIRASGIESVYSHQAEAIGHCLEGRNVVLSTSTASGKTLAYQAPVLDRLIRDPRAHGLFLFPLKALERDQRDAFLALAGARGITAAVYDGDTPESERRKIRKSPPRVIITNPDMLHLALLAYHDSWKDFFANLHHVVLDEVHTYKGIFGSHISQVLLRVRRVCEFYGAEPRFFACSATVANPGGFVSGLIGEEVSVVDRSGAPMSTRHFVFLRPELSPYTVASRLFVEGLEAGLKTIVFTRARKITELITTWVLQEASHLKGRISSYRAGFLPEERRDIEAKLFSGKMDGVISTSALEMGIDVGGLDLCLLVGYPGTIINTWQRGGRVGRAGRRSAIVLIAGNDALDQYFLKHPDDFFGRSCEEAILDPFNEEVLKRHLPCAAAETPIRSDEQWARKHEVRTVLDELERAGRLYRNPDTGSLHAYGARPHRQVDLRGIGESYAIFLEDGKTSIGSSSGIRALTECHEGAVYLHRTRQYVVTGLDLNRRNVLVRPARVNYYTRALSEKDTEILGSPIDTREFPGFTVRLGRLKVTQRIVAYEKRRTAGQDLIGNVDLDLPPVHFETVGIWIEIPDRVKEAARIAGLHFMGGIHALEHAAISIFPLFALCDRDDIGGISTPEHQQVCRAAVFIYDGHPGGVGLCRHIFGLVEDLLEKTRSLVEGCGCEEGCPSCIHSPKCGSGNKPLDKAACLSVLECLLDPEAAPLLKNSPPPRSEESPSDESPGPETPSQARGKRSGRPIFPDLSTKPGRGPELSHPLRSAQGSERRAREDRGPEASGPARGSTRKSGTKSGANSMKPNPEPRRIVVFDLETKRLARDVGGWGNIRRMGLSLAVTFTEEDGFLTFTEENVLELVNQLKSADLVVGFNHVRFDYEVLEAYTSEDLRRLPNLDILAHVAKALGFRLKLDHLGKYTLGKEKSGDGLDAVKWFQEGRMDLIEKYCRDDVEITRDLYYFGRDNRFLLYQRRDRVVDRIPVQW